MVTATNLPACHFRKHLLCRLRFVTTLACSGDCTKVKAGHCRWVCDMLTYWLQAIGWHTHKKLANDQDPNFALSATDVTIKEGRSVADYFGFLA